jgi:hypothetical protein
VYDDAILLLGNISPYLIVDQYEGRVCPEKLATETPIFLRELEAPPHATRRAETAMNYRRAQKQPASTLSTAYPEAPGTILIRFRNCSAAMEHDTPLLAAPWRILG